MTHPFFAKALKQTLVTPNKIVVRSRTDDEDQYSGEATNAESYALMPKVEYFETYLTSNDQAEDIAEAKLAMSEMWSKAGSVRVPMNLAQEPFDYIRVVDSREGDERVGNIGRLTRHYSVSPQGRQSSRWEMVATFGDWQCVRKALANLNISSDDLQNSFTRLYVKNLYAEHIQADSLDLVWLDPDNTIDLSKIGDTLDHLPDGEQYARVKSVHLDAEGGLKLDENVWYQPGYDPSTKEKGIAKQATAPADPQLDDFWLDTSVTPNLWKRWNGSAWVKATPANQDDLPNGALYRRCKSTAVTTDGIVVLDNVQVGTYGLVKSTGIRAGQIRLDSCYGDMDDIDQGQTWGSIRLACMDGNGYLELNSNTKVNGEWYNNTGVLIDSSKGIRLYGTDMAFGTFANVSDVRAGTNWKCKVDANGAIVAGAGNVLLNSSGITVKGAKLTLQDSGGGHGGTLYVDTSGRLRLDGAGWGGSVLVGELTSTYGISAGTYISATTFLYPGKAASQPIGSEGGIVFNTVSGNLNIFSAHLGGWRHFNLDVGWA